MKLNFFLLLLLSFYIVNSTLYITHATVRFVSKTGTSQPPYTSWQTAADSIQKCINICSFGDTIYVANGVYQEQIIMLPGLSLIGAGIDSCVIDTRQISSPGFRAVTVSDTCNFKGFQIIVSNERYGSGIYTRSRLGEIMDNLIKNTGLSITLDKSNIVVESNYFIETNDGVFIAGLGIPSNPKIISNYILIDNENGRAIFFDFTPQTKPEIYNNTIFLDGDFARGFSGNATDTAKIFNNLLISHNASYGLANVIIPTLNVNNFLIGIYNFRGINAETHNVIRNNTIVNGEYGIYKDAGDNPIISYNNSFNNTFNYSGFTPDSTNLSVNPMIVNDDTTRGELDFHLQMFSPLIDAGDPNILDKDGSRSDIGLFGGPFGESYKYLDLTPSPPLNLTALVDSNYITLNWNRNTEADTSYYRVYRDTVLNFTIDSTKLVSSSSDTFFVQINPHNVTKYVYKLTCVDKQGNESNPSEEKVVVITDIEHYPQFITDYQLYQNYPNPFNPSTKISYRLKERGNVKLYVYDIKGELARVLVNQEQNAGFYQVDFNTTNYTQPASNSFASGIYIYQIMIKNDNNIPVFTESKKMIFLK